jgi:hypothetical protein
VHLTRALVHLRQGCKTPTTSLSLSHLSLYARQRSQAERREKRRSSKGRAVLASAGELGLEDMISISIDIDGDGNGA